MQMGVLVPYDPLNASDPRNNPGYGYTEENQYQGGAGASPPTPLKPEEPCKSKIACAGVIVNCKCAFKWYIDADKDGYSSTILITETAVPHPGAQYKLGSPFGPDCDDKNPKVQKLNKCGKCEVESVSGNCPCNTNAADLMKMFPPISDEKAKQLADVLNRYAGQFGIDTKEKLQHFLAQVKKESADLTKFTEDSEYYKLKSVSKSGHGFYKYFFETKSNEKHRSYLRKISEVEITGSVYLEGKKLFNIVYDDRNLIRDRGYLNGNTQDGDGYNFRGGGALQLTGREKYTNFNKFYNNLPGVTPRDFTKNPELIQNNTDNLGIVSSMWFFMTEVLKPIKDFQSRATSPDANIRINLNSKVTEKVQGTDETAPDRLKNLELAQQIIKCN